MVFTLSNDATAEVTAAAASSAAAAAVRGSARVVIFVRCKLSCSGVWFYLPSEIHVCCLAFVVCWDRGKLQYLSRAQSDWAETWWIPWVGIPD
jgi:hypothetical protein